MDHTNAVQKLFEYFYSRIYKTNFKLDLEKNNHRQLIANFLTLLYKQYQPEAVGVNLLIEYYVYAFEYWISKQTKRKMSLSWIIGKKFFQRWQERRESASYYSQQFIREYSIDINTLRSELIEQLPNDPLQVHQSEELEKSRFPDTEGRIYNCSQTTTLFNHRSIVCTTCMQKLFCKQLLKKVNLSLYEKRGYVTKA